MIISNFTDLESSLANLNDTHLIRLVYSSKISKKGRSDPNLFQQIQKSAEDYNRINNIKGLLCNDHNHFFQCLEGVKKVILILMSKIFNDKRHKQLKVILLKPIDNYQFTSWCMRCLNLDHPSFQHTPQHFDVNELQQFLPLKPLSWSDWYIEYFIDSMQRFEESNKYGDSEEDLYNIIRDPQPAITSLFDSMILHGFMLVLVFVLIIIGLKHSFSYVGVFSLPEFVK